MDSWDTAQLAADDKRYVWHPFTAMGDWCAPGHEPLILVRAEGAIVHDSRDREYIDGNSSIWTNIHGHNHPRINAAIRAQLERVAHTSFLGTTNPTAIQLAREIVKLVPGDQFGRVFYSDDGSTGMEAALRIVNQYWRLQEAPERRTFVAFRNAYHGDTAGAASLGAASMFGARLEGFQFPVERVGDCEELDALPHPERIAAVAIEPMIQGAAGMKIWPAGTLRQLRQWCDWSGALLIADEVMTGFGRTGKMFACEHDGANPDLYVFAKGLTGGYLPLALTLVTDKVFEPFRSSDPTATFFYGHSYTGNALGCAAALASLDIFQEEQTLQVIAPKISLLSRGLAELGLRPEVRNARTCGMIGAFEVAGPAGTAAKVCQQAREYGLLTRHIRDTIVLLPPLCITPSQIDTMLNALHKALGNVVTSNSEVVSSSFGSP